jgi:uncharacterized UPF0160 family protein
MGGLIGRAEGFPVHKEELGRRRRRSFGTHSGSFHADEVTACALLLLVDLIEVSQIIRTRDLSRLDLCQYVCDVGGVYDVKSLRFDHHQADYIGPLSSAGMVLAYLRQEGILEDHFGDYLKKSLIDGIDAHDNGVVGTTPGVTSFSQVASSFAPVRYDAPEEAMGAAFMEAVQFVLTYLRKLQERFVYTASCKASVQRAMEGRGPVLIFSESIPWLESFFEMGGKDHPALFVLMPAGDHWKLRGIPPTLDERMKVRRPFPSDWAGLHDEDLEAVSGISGAIFCHKGRFISIWETKDSAEKALDCVLSKP